MKLNTLVGGRFFPGKHYLARFNVAETASQYHIDFVSSDATRVLVDATETTTFDNHSIFKTLENASAFFEGGSVGYSPNKNSFEGVQLKTDQWKVTPLAVHKLTSGFFEDEAVFPKGSIRFDHALLMKNTEHEWHSVISK